MLVRPRVLFFPSSSFSSHTTLVSSSLLVRGLLPLTRFSLSPQPLVRASSLLPHSRSHSLSLSRSLQLSHTLPNHSIGTSTFDSRKRKHSRRPLSRDSLPPPLSRPSPTSLATHLHASFIAAASSSTSALVARTVVCGREVVRGLGTQPALTSRRSGRVRYHPRESTTSPYESPLSGVHSGGAIFLNFCESTLVS